MKPKCDDCLVGFNTYESSQNELRVFSESDLNSATEWDWEFRAHRKPIREDIHNDYNYCPDCGHEIDWSLDEKV